MTASEQLHTLPVTVSNPDQMSALSNLEVPDSIPEIPLDDRSQSADPDNPRWGLRSALLVWIVSIVSIVLMPVVFLLPYAWSRGFRPSMPNFGPALAEFALNDKTAVLLQVVSLLPSHLITLILIWAVVTRFGKKSFWTAIGWDWPSNFPWWLSVLLGIVLFGLGTLIALLLGSEKQTQLEQIINSSMAARYTIVVLAVGTAPFVEELVYRGVLYAALRRDFGVFLNWVLSVFNSKLDTRSRDRLVVWSAATLVLFLFTIIHVPQYWPNAGVIAAVALLSIVLTVVRAYSRRLLPCVVIHMIFNGIQAVILLAEPQVRKMIPPVEPTASMILPLIRAIF